MNGPTHPLQKKVHTFTSITPARFIDGTQLKYALFGNIGDLFLPKVDHVKRNVLDVVV